MCLCDVQPDHSFNAYSYHSCSAQFVWNCSDCETAYNLLIEIGTLEEEQSNSIQALVEGLCPALGQQWPNCTELLPSLYRSMALDVIIEHTKSICYEQSCPGTDLKTIPTGPAWTPSSSSCQECKARINRITDAYGQESTISTWVACCAAHDLAPGEGDS
jgi:hypothetical protein